LTSSKYEHFCQGTDFRSLLYSKKEENFDMMTGYLSELYSLQTITAKLNKPVVAVASGHVYNSGAAWLQSTGFPITTPSARVAFNDVQFGFVPHGGSTFYLSRLPGELGTFLAVTGLPLTGIDAAILGVSDKLHHSSKVYERDVRDILLNLDFPIPNHRDLSDKGRINPWARQVKMKKKWEKGDFESDLFERGKRNHENVHAEEFYEPKDKYPSTIGDSNFLYKQQLKMFDKLHYRDQMEGGYLEYQEVVYQNYYKYILDYLKTYTDQEFSHNEQTVHKHIQEINRCFFSNSIEEIMDNLRRENTAFAQACLDQMTKNSMLSMKLALKMVR